MKRSHVFIFVCHVKIKSSFDKIRCFIKKSYSQENVETSWESGYVSAFYHKSLYWSSNLRICSFNSSIVLSTSNGTVDTLDALDLLVVVRLLFLPVVASSCSSVVGSCAPDILDLRPKFPCGIECRLCLVIRRFSWSVWGELLPQLLLDRVTCIDSSESAYPIWIWPILTRWSIRTRRPPRYGWKPPLLGAQVGRVAKVSVVTSCHFI